MTKQRVIAITGPSSSGKTALSIELAKELNGEVISVDSRQIYKELDIGSAKPDIKERQGIKHHMLDIIDVTMPYTVADYCDEAKLIIKDIIERGKLPILSGGTGLYFRSLLQDFDLPRVAPDNELREKLNEKSAQELYDMLKKLDEKSAEKIHFNNKVKIIRALEVCITLGIPMSSAQKKKENQYDTLWIGLNSLNRDFLYERINKRVDIMMKKGLLDEVSSLFNKYENNNILLNTIGYQEFYPYFKGDCSLEEAVNQLKQNTRRYAKRQISWFNANKDISWYYIEKHNLEEISLHVIDKYKKLLS